MSNAECRMSRVIIALALFLSFSSVAAQEATAGPARTKKPPAAARKTPVPEKPKPPAEKVAGVLQEFIVQAEMRHQGKNPPDKVVRLSEGEINAYMQQAIKAKARYGVTSVYIKLIGPNHVGATTTIDFDKVKVEDQSLAVRMVRSLLSGERQIYVEGYITSSDGTGQFKLEKAYFEKVRLPVYFIDKVINYLGRRQNPPVDTSQPAPLPYGLKKMEIGAGSIVLRG